MTDFEIAIQRLENLSLKPATPKAVAGDLFLVISAAKSYGSMAKRLKDAIEEAECALSALQCGNKNDDDEYPAQFMDKVEEHLCNIIEPPQKDSQP